MFKEVIVSKRASDDYLSVIRYLYKKWTIKEIEKFERRFLKAVLLIQKNPNSFNISKKNTRRYVMDKHNIIHYRIKKEVIEIVAIWPGKRNPRKMKL